MFVFFAETDCMKPSNQINQETQRNMSMSLKNKLNWDLNMMEMR